MGRWQRGTRRGEGGLDVGVLSAQRPKRSNMIIQRMVEGDRIADTSGLRRTPPEFG